MAADSPDLLHDQTMEDMDAPPELGAIEGPPGGTPAAIPGCCPPAMSCLSSIAFAERRWLLPTFIGYIYICPNMR